MSLYSIFRSSVPKFVSLHIKVENKRKTFYTQCTTEVNKYFLYSQSFSVFHLMRKALMSLKYESLILELVNIFQMPL